MQSRSVWKGIIFLTVTQLLIPHVLSAPTSTCGSSQKQRTDTNGLPICCYTTRCNKSQQFEFCTSDQGYDSCKDCPPGTYTEDTINTADWDIKPDVCVTLPHCNPEEIMVGNICQCAVGKGYYGNRDNCILDLNCKGAGFQLQNDGSCVACDSEHYKPEDGIHGICRNKSRCNVDDMEASPGTLTTDRTCVKVNVTTTSTQSTTAVPVPNPGNNTPGGGLAPGVIAAIVMLCVFLVVLVVLCIFCRKEIRNRCRPKGNCQILRLLKIVNDGENQVPEVYPMIENPSEVTPNGLMHTNGFASKNSNLDKHPEIKGDTKTTDNKDIVNGLKSSTYYSEYLKQTDPTVKDDPLADPITGGPDECLLSDYNNSATTDSSQTFPKTIMNNCDKTNLTEDNYKFSLLSDNSLLNTSDNLSSVSFSSNEQTEDAPTTSDTDSTEEKSVYYTSQPKGNIPDDQLFYSLKTLANTETFNTARDVNPSPVESQVNDNGLFKKIATVPPTFRHEPRGNTGQCPNASTVSIVSPDGTSSTDRSDTDPNQGFPASPTTASGLDVQQATIEGNDKLVANAPYGELQVDMTGRCPSDEASDTEEALSSTYVTESGQLLMSPESDGSYDHSINDSSEPQIVDRESTENNQPDHDRENMQ